MVLNAFLQSQVANYDASSHTLSLTWNQLFEHLNQLFRNQLTLADYQEIVAYPLKNPHT